MGNSLAETGKRGQRIKTEAALHLMAMEQLFLSISKRRSERRIKTKEKAETLARYLLNLWNGINITRRVYPRKDLLEQLSACNWRY